MKDLISEEIYLVLSVVGLVFFIFWAIRDGIIRKDISFGNIGNVRKTAKAATVWGIVFTTLGIFLLVLILIVRLS